MIPGECEMCDRTRDGVQIIETVYGRVGLCPSCLEYWRHQYISHCHWYSASERYRGIVRISKDELDALVRDMTDLHPDWDMAKVGLALTDLGYTITPDEIDGSAERLGVEIAWRELL